MDEILAIYDKLNIIHKNLAISFQDLEKAHENNQILNMFFNRLKSLGDIWLKDYMKQKE